MQTTYVKFPFYAKLSFILLALVLGFGLVYIARDVFIPLFLSVLFAILLRPVAVFFNKKLRFPYVLAVLVSVLLFIIAFLSLVVFISYQASNLAEDWMRIKENLTHYYHSIQDWIRNRWNISYYRQEEYVEQVTKGNGGGNLKWAGQTLGVFKDALVVFVLAPVYIFLLLFYKQHLIVFLHKLVPDKGHSALIDILTNIKVVIQNYMVGLLLEMGIVCTLVTVGLMIVGAKYALLLGLISALLNLIPYIGITFATILAMFVTMAETSKFGTVVGVFAVNVIVQLIDNNFLVPKIVGSKVRINALVAIFVVVVGGTIAGVAGMFLSLPFAAIVKVIFDRIDGLKEWGFLMGDAGRPKSNSKKWIVFPSREKTRPDR